MDLLETNQVDLIIANTPNAKLNSLENVKTIHEFQDVFLVNTNYFPDIDLSMSLTKLQSYPILMLGKNSTTSQFLHSIFLQNQLDLIPAIELSSNDLLIDLAKIGLGVAFVPDFCLKSDMSDLKAIQIKERLPKRKIVAAYSNQLPLSAAASYFLESLSFKDRM